MTETGTTSDSGAGVSIEIDHERCQGTGACARELPEVFVVIGGSGDETGKSHVRSDAAWDRVDSVAIKEAAQACPWAAIEVTDS